MGILQVCKVSANMAELKKDGTSGTPQNVHYYFEGSSIYNNTDMATCTGIEMIPADKWDGSHPLIPVANLIQSGVLNRLNVLVKDSSNKKRRYNVVVAQSKVGKAIGGTAAEQLDGKSINILRSDGSTINRGTIIRVGGKTDAYTP